MPGYIIGGLLLLFVAVVAIRTALFRPKAQPQPDTDPVELDETACIHALQELVQCKTISYNDPSLEDEAEFQKLISKLPTLYPRVFEVCSVDSLPGRALLLRWPGKSGEAPTVLMSHYDVVPADEEKWEKPPFAGIIEDGVLWGRGTLDTKGTMNAARSAADHLISQASSRKMTSILPSPAEKKSTAGARPTLWNGSSAMVSGRHWWWMKAAPWWKMSSPA